MLTAQVFKTNHPKKQDFLFKIICNYKVNSSKNTSTLIQIDVKPAGYKNKPRKGGKSLSSLSVFGVVLRSFVSEVNWLSSRTPISREGHNLHHNTAIHNTMRDVKSSTYGTAVFISCTFQVNKMCHWIKF